MNTNSQMYSCCLDRNHSHALLFAILAFFAAIGPHTMRILQDKIPVIVQSTQPNRWTKQQLQQIITNRHVICDTVLREHLLHRISYTMKNFTLLISNLHGNANEPYGRVVHPTNDDMSKVNPDDDRLDSTNGTQVAASSSGGGGGGGGDDDDDNDDPYKRKPHNNGCGGDKSPADRNEKTQDDDQDHENGFTGEPVDVFGSDDPDDFPNIVLDDDMDIDEDDMVEVGVVDEIGEEDLVGLWEECGVAMKQETTIGQGARDEERIRQRPRTG